MSEEMKVKLEELDVRRREAAPQPEGFNVFFQGAVMFIVRDQQGNIVDTWQRKNTIVYTADLLAAELIRGDSVPGITHLAIGSGDPAWDPQNPPAPTKTQVQLESEVLRVPVTASFIDPDTGNPMSPQEQLDADGVNQQRTYIVDFKASIGPDEANTDLMEMGLFGGVAADQPGKGTMINYFTFKRWTKTPGMSIDIIWRISTRHTDYQVDFGTCAVACQELCETSCQTGCQVTCEDACQVACQDIGQGT